ncbi:MAG: hypothetical protein Q9228_000901 [Teloschistes exilis]
MVLPVLVTTPQAETFCLVRVFWTAETKRPVPPRIMVEWRERLMASWGWMKIMEFQ